MSKPQNRTAYIPALYSPLATASRVIVACVHGRRPAVEGYEWPARRLLLAAGFPSHCALRVSSAALGLYRRWPVHHDGKRAIILENHLRLFSTNICITRAPHGLLVVQSTVVKRATGHPRRRNHLKTHQRRGTKTGLLS